MKWAHFYAFSIKFLPFLLVRYSNSVKFLFFLSLNVFTRISHLIFRFAFLLKFWIDIIAKVSLKQQQKRKKKHWCTNIPLEPLTTSIFFLLFFSKKKKKLKCWKLAVPRFWADAISLNRHFESIFGRIHIWRCSFDFEMSSK